PERRFPPWNHAKKRRRRPHNLAPRRRGRNASGSSSWRSASPRAREETTPTEVLASCSAAARRGYVSRKSCGGTFVWRARRSSSWRLFGREFVGRRGESLLPRPLCPLLVIGDGYERTHRPRAHRPLRFLRLPHTVAAVRRVAGVGRGGGGPVRARRLRA